MGQPYDKLRSEVIMRTELKSMLERLATTTEDSEFNRALEVIATIYGFTLERETKYKVVDQKYKMDF